LKITESREIEILLSKKTDTLLFDLVYLPEVRPFTKSANSKNNPQ